MAEDRLERIKEIHKAYMSPPYSSPCGDECETCWLISELERARSQLSAVREQFERSQVELGRQKARARELERERDKLAEEIASKIWDLPDGQGHGYKRGAASMRERAAKVAEDEAEDVDDGYSDRAIICRNIAQEIRGLPDD